VPMCAPETPARMIAQYRRRMNSFANKWLEHLLDVGYGGGQWRLLGTVPEWDRSKVIAPGAEADADERVSRASKRRVRPAVHSA